jgi:hypothetical protein
MLDGEVAVLLCCIFSACVFKDSEVVGYSEAQQHTLTIIRKREGHMLTHMWSNMLLGSAAYAETRMR